MFFVGMKARYNAMIEVRGLYEKDVRCNIGIVVHGECISTRTIA